MKDTKLKKRVKAVFFKRNRDVFNPAIKKRQFKHIKPKLPYNPKCPDCV